MILARDRAHQIASKLALHTLAFIDGAFAPALNGATFLTLNPATGSEIVAVAHCGSADVGRAVAAARRVFDAGSWSRGAPEKRNEVLIRLASPRACRGAHASVFTCDIDRALHFARRLPSGTVIINSFSEGDVTTPFGGYKRSGSLARDNGIEAMDQYQQTKTIWIATSAPKGLT